MPRPELGESTPFVVPGLSNCRVAARVRSTNLGDRLNAGAPSGPEIERGAVLKRDCAGIST